MLAFVLWSCGGQTGDSRPGLPASAAAFCDELTVSDAADAVGVACVEEPTLDGEGHPRPCDDLGVTMVAKGDVDTLCASCEAAGTACERTEAVDCTASNGATLSVYSFWCPPGVP